VEEHELWSKRKGVGGNEYRNACELLP